MWRASEPHRPLTGAVDEPVLLAIRMIGTPKGDGVTPTRYAGLGVSGSVMTVAGSVLRPDGNPSGVDDAGAVSTDAVTACRGGEGWLLTSVASTAGRASRAGRNRRFIMAGGPSASLRTPTRRPSPDSRPPSPCEASRGGQPLVPHAPAGGDHPIGGER